MDRHSFSGIEFQVPHNVIVCLRESTLIDIVYQFVMFICLLYYSICLFLFWMTRGTRTMDVLLKNSKACIWGKKQSDFYCELNEVMEQFVFDTQALKFYENEAIGIV